MPYRYLRLPDIDLLYVELSGVLTLGDLKELQAEVLSDPSHRLEMSKLVALHGISDTALDFSSLLSLRGGLAELYYGQSKMTKWSLFAPSNLSFGMARMFQTLLTEIPPIRAQVFQNPDAALAFVGTDRVATGGRLNLWDAPAHRPVSRKQLEPRMTWRGFRSRYA